MQKFNPLRVSTVWAVHSLALAMLAFCCSPAFTQDYYNGFEVDTYDWTDAVRVPSGTGGVISADGAWHATGATGDTPFTKWGGYSSVFPAGGYTTSIDIYLDVNAGLANDTRFDFSSAINTPAGNHRRDFVFNAGFYDGNDSTGPGANSKRFVVSASNSAGRENSYPKNPGRDPIAIDESGWYTFEHAFSQDVDGVLVVDLSITAANGDLVGSWTLSDASDVIGVTVGGNRYGWFASNELGSKLAFDNAQKLSDSDGDQIPDSLDDCPNSDFSPLVDVGSGATTIDNVALGVDEFGCTVQDRVNECADAAKNHGQYVSCIGQLADELYNSGDITKAQRQQMKTGAAKSSVGK
ncbi:MAG: hypothetical protein ACTHOU_06795 [Aureliella sp.]